MCKYRLDAFVLGAFVKLFPRNHSTTVYGGIREIVYGYPVRYLSTGYKQFSYKLGVLLNLNYYSIL